MQGVLASAMHCVDVVIGFRNDEDSWQSAYSQYAETANAFVPKKYQAHWRTSLFFVVKSGVQWVFGYAVSVDIIFTLSLIPVAVTAAILLVSAIFIEAMARKEPKEGGPTTYGEFGLLMESISAYHLIWV